MIKKCIAAGVIALAVALGACSLWTPAPLPEAEDSVRRWDVPPEEFTDTMDYSLWAEQVGYPLGMLRPLGREGLGQDYFHTPENDPAYLSGRIVVGDSRCCQLGILQQRTGGADFAAYAVWGGHYNGELGSLILTKDQFAELERCFRAQVRDRGSSTIYFFATVNDYDFAENDNDQSIRAAVDTARMLAGLTCRRDGADCRPRLVVVGFAGCREDGPFSGIPCEVFNRYVEDFTARLFAAVGEDPVLAGARCVTAEESAPAGIGFIADGLHYSDPTLAGMIGFLTAPPPD